MLWENSEYLSVEMTVGKYWEKLRKRAKSVKILQQKKAHALNEKREWNSTHEWLFYYYA
jgi:hypothetical protein